MRNHTKLTFPGNIDKGTTENKVRPYMLISSTAFYSQTFYTLSKLHKYILTGIEKC